MTSAKLVRHSDPKGGETDRPKPGTVAEGRNEKERQVGHESQERQAQNVQGELDFSSPPAGEAREAEREETESPPACMTSKAHQHNR